MRILAGVTAIRIKMQLTQTAFGQLIGVTKTMVSMVENGHRGLSALALQKLSLLELDFLAREAAVTSKPACPIPLPERERQTFIRETKESINRKQLQELEYELAAMKAQHADLQAATRYIGWANESNFHPGIAVVLEAARLRLHKKLRRCSEQAQASHLAKIARLRILTDAAMGAVTVHQFSNASCLQLPYAASRETNPAIYRFRCCA